MTNLVSASAETSITSAEGSSTTTAEGSTSSAKGSKSSKISSRTYTTLEDEATAPKREPLSDFDCTDKIYTVAELNGYELGKHAFSVKWIDPAGELREHTQYPFFVHNDEEHRLWAWLLLSRARGAGMLTFINPAAGLEEFVGEWKVEVRIDKQLISSSQFIVSC